MPEQADPANKKSGDLRPKDAALGVGVVALMALCCGGPALIAAGALGAVGGFVANPFVILAAIVVAFVAVTGVLRRARRAGGADCCPPNVTAPEDTRERKTFR